MNGSWVLVCNGRWTGQLVVGSRAAAEQCLQPGWEVIEGRPWELIASGALLPPEAPPSSLMVEAWEWNNELQRHVGRPSRLASDRQTRNDVIARIGELEAATARPLRELLLDPADTAARQRLAVLNTQIAALRSQLPSP